MSGNQFIKIMETRRNGTSPYFLEGETPVLINSARIESVEYSGFKNLLYIKLNNGRDYYTTKSFEEIEKEINEAIKFIQQ